MNAAFSFWPALNLPTAIVPLRRSRERSHSQSRGENLFSRASVAPEAA